LEYQCGAGVVSLVVSRSAEAVDTCEKFQRRPLMRGGLRNEPLAMMRLSLPWIGHMTDCCTPARSDPTDRIRLVGQALRLEWLTVGWMVVEAVVAITSGVAAGSLVLLAFGLDSVIELASAGVLIWRLSVELQHGGEFSERAERVASRIAGWLLIILAAYVVVAAIWRLWTGTGQEFAWGSSHRLD
jgi:hypothetical protein